MSTPTPNNSATTSAEVDELDKVDELAALVQSTWTDEDEFDPETIARAFIAAGFVTQEAHRAEVEQLTIERDQARADRQAAWDGLRETEPKVDRIKALAADLQRRGDTEGARLIFAALNGERA